MNVVFGDITRSFETGRRFANLSTSSGRSFCDSSNRLLGSVLVMFLRARRWPAVAGIFQIQLQKRTCANAYK